MAIDYFGQLPPALSVPAPPFLEDPEAVINPKMEPDEDYSPSPDPREISLDHSFNSQSVLRRPRVPLRDDDSHDFSERLNNPSRISHTSRRKRPKFMRSLSRELQADNPAPMFFPTTCDNVPPLTFKEEAPKSLFAITTSNAVPPPLNRRVKKQKQKAVKRAKPEKVKVVSSQSSQIGSEEDEESKKAKQERNRVCARECRRRKKIYLESMEAQAKALREELVECRKELASYKAKEQEGLLSQFNDTQILSEAVRRLEMDAKNGIDGNAKDLLHKYLTQCEVNIQTRKAAINSLSQKMLQLLLPDTEKYFLWSAAAKESLFDFSTRRNLRRRQKGDVNKKLTPKTTDWGGIWEIVKLSKAKKENLLNIQELLIESKKRLQNSVHDFLTAKNKLWEEAERISSIVKSKALSVFSYKRTLNVILWIHSKRNEWELAEEVLYGLKDYEHKNNTTAASGSEDKRSAEFPVIKSREGNT